MRIGPTFSLGVARFVSFRVYGLTLSSAATTLPHLHRDRLARHVRRLLSFCYHRSNGCLVAAARNAGKGGNRRMTKASVKPRRTELQAQFDTPNRATRAGYHVACHAAIRATYAAKGDTSVMGIK